MASPLIFSPKKLSDFTTQFERIESDSNKEAAAIKLENLLAESPTYSHRQSKMTASPTLSDPRKYFLPRYCNESSLKKPASEDKLLITFGGEVLFSKVIKESEEKEVTIEAQDQDTTNVLRLKPKEQQYSDLAIRDIKITCQRHPNCKAKKIADKK